MDLITSNNSTLSLGTTTVCTTSGEYDADTWQAVANVEDLGEFGDAAEIISFQALSDGRVRKSKGASDAGDMNVVLGLDPTDTGLANLLTAQAASSGYNIKVERDDQITATTGNPTTYYFRAIVASVRYNMGNASNIQRVSVQLAITSAIVIKAAA